eukprot:TRINITY_DN26970_c0_g1_i1.p2 TRINITY_DN26970_c0_g1~~TRINITY_DN26970_c0_g1_i1.p2  ORF type:complete len:191 (+),score=55.44 TRINITY_DN26970_c0_g1_i1:732-1304(+)
MSIKPKRFGLKYDPPTLLLEYETAQKKKRRRSMPVKGLAPSSTASKIVDDLVKKNPQHLGARVVSSKQLTRLIQKLLDRQKKPTAAPLASMPASKPSLSSLPKASVSAKDLLPDFGDKDLNKLGDAELKAAKSQMDTAFEATRLKPGDPGYQYDKRIEFKPAAEASDWDDGDDDIEEEVDDEVDWDELLK